MPTTIADVLSVLDDLILEHFNETRASGGATTPFLAFEAGTPIPEETFHVPPEDPRWSPALALEYLSHHANAVPRVHDGLFERTGNTIDGLYQILLFGATPTDAANMELLGHIKSPAEAAFEITLGSLLVPEERFRPTHANPVNWFEGASDNWTTLRVDRTNRRPASRPTKALDPALLTWAVASPAVRPVLSVPVSARSLSTIASLEAAEQLRSAEPLRPVLVAPKLEMNTSLRSALTVGPKKVKVAPTEQLQLIKVHPAAMAEATRALFPKPVQPGRPVAPPAKQPPVSSDILSVKVEICVVNLRRPWLSGSLLSLKNWYVPTFAKGSFSGGTGPGDPGKFSALPIACILIRNLEIKAQWSEEDQKHVESSTNLGTLSLLGRRFDKTSATLTVPGMQSAAWICDPLPVLPPADPPAA